MTYRGSTPTENRPHPTFARSHPRRTALHRRRPADGHLPALQRPADARSPERRQPAAVGLDGRQPLAARSDVGRGRRSRLHQRRHGGAGRQNADALRQRDDLVRFASARTGSCTGVVTGRSAPSWSTTSHRSPTSWCDGWRSATTAGEHAISVTSYNELVLGPPADDFAHPAFSKLFVHTEYLGDCEALIATRQRLARAGGDVGGAPVRRRAHGRPSTMRRTACASSVATAPHETRRNCDRLEVRARPPATCSIPSSRCARRFVCRAEGPPVC